MRLSYGTYVTAPEALDPEVDAAAEAGFDAVVFSEHHGMRGYVPDPLTAATYVLGRRADLLAGPMPILLPLHDPVAVAEAAALADALSGGRLVFGVAAGYLASEFEQRGIDLASRGARLEEATTVIRRIWAAEPGGYAGDHYVVPPIDPLAQPPHQPGGPPIMMACGTPAGLRRASRVADGIVLDSVRSPGAIAALAGRFQEERARLGREPGRVAVMRRGWIGSDEEAEGFVAQLQAELSSFASKSVGTSMPWLDEPDGLSLEAVPRGPSRVTPAPSWISSMR